MNLQKIHDDKTAKIKKTIKQMDIVSCKIEKLEKEYRDLQENLGKLRDERQAISTTMKLISEEQCLKKPSRT